MYKIQELNIGAIAREDNSALLQVTYQVGLEQVSIGQALGWSKAEKLPDLAWIGGLCTKFFSQHFGKQGNQHPINVCEPGNERLPTLGHKMCWSGCHLRRNIGCS